MLVNVKKLQPNAIIPKYATRGSACFDLHSVGEGVVDDIRHPSWIFPTGLAFEVPEGYVMLVFSRSGHGFKNNVRLSNCVGVIDSDYRGEIKVSLAADSEGRLDVKYGDRIAQAMILPVQQVSFALVDELSDTDRGTGGFGSTGDA